MTNEEDINKFINTPMINDDFFFDKKFKDEISGNDYKEIIKKITIKYLMKKENKNIQIINNINENLKKYEKEKEKSKNFFYLKKNNN